MRSRRLQLPQLPMLGDSPFAAAARRHVEATSHFDEPILLTGPAGSGKEGLARAMHAASSRGGKPFIKIDCALLSAGDFFDSQVFGHLPGNFAGLKTSSLGLIQAANGGTVYLAGVESLELESQWKLLRTWQDQAVMPVGGGEAIPVDFRMIAGTTVDLRLGVGVGLFRRDFYSALTQHTISLPALAERAEDIPALAEYVLSAVAAHKKLEVTPRFSAEALGWLQSYHWPGNFVEFSRAVEASLELSQQAMEIDLKSVRQSMRKLHGDSAVKTRRRVPVLRRTRFAGFAALRNSQVPACVSQN